LSPSAEDAGASQPTERDAGVEIPRATYRLQLHAGFGFEQAAAIVPYLAELGISHAYCSPYLEARAGSTHGYDIVNHGQLDPEIGDADAFETFYVALRRHGMGQILDIVPNHMGVSGSDNRWWLDVLENGPASEYAEFFDIDWRPLKDELRGKVLLPILGDHYGNVLDRGEIELRFDASLGTFAIAYFEHRCPVDPSDYPRILEPGLDRLKSRMADDDESLVMFESLLTAFRNLPSRNDVADQARAERMRDKGLHSARLARLARTRAEIGDYIEECVERINAERDVPADERSLHALLEAQAYRLAYWRVASESINYRRFFDINALASLRMENSAVFNAAHALVLDLIARGRLQGLRIDHPDGLYDPAGYFRRLQAHAARALGKNVTGESAFYVVAEKILAAGETLREDWLVHGTTGYEFANLVGRLLVRPDGARALEDDYRAFCGSGASYTETLYRSKRLIMQVALASELNVLAAELDRIAESDPHTRDFGLGGLRTVLLETIACFPVYRTYVAGHNIAAADEAFLRRAVARAKRRSEAADTTVFDFLLDVLLMTAAEGRGADYRERIVRFVMRFQQYTAPVAAKGMEDTAFYRYAWLAGLNEVGGSPEAPTVSIAEFHEANARRFRDWPHEMLASSTHDSKRSEDVRARLAVLSELPRQWAEHRASWAAVNADAKRVIDAEPLPDRATEDLLYQTLIGAWPLGRGRDAANDEVFRQRIRDYMRKAAREAKQRTSWINPDPAYEDALVAFVDAVLERSPFLERFLPLQRRIARLGLLNGLSQLVLKLTAPGVPDIYQGNELWTFDLVDPDNRHEVDFARRSESLASLREADARDRQALVTELVREIDDGRLKLYLTWRLLTLRRDQEPLFTHGGYGALAAQGADSDRVCSFRREANGSAVVVATLRWLASAHAAAEQAWSAESLDADTFIPIGGESREFVDWLSGRRVRAQAGPGGAVLPIRSLFAAMPVALLVDAE
jgi:(1->4)-alpha-D-glucan 1-alpha-D-glucosylmutase